MRVNTGGAIDPKNVVGRDRLIALLWRVLERQSLLLNAERRIGKTSIIRKMEAEKQPGFLLIYRDLEDVATPDEFVERIWRDIAKYLPLHIRAVGTLREIFERIGGTEVEGLVKLPKFTASDGWKALLLDTLTALGQAQKEQKLVFLWDELPFMLSNIRDRAGEATAMELLDTLRAIRQGQPSLRMVFTGSIGLHHVLTSLRDAGHANAPVNDMSIETVAPLVESDARTLAMELLNGEQIEVAGDMEAISTRVAALSDGVPYYIHHLVEQLWRKNETVTVDDVDAALAGLLDDPQDRLNLSYYEERLDRYYEDLSALAKAALDVLATASEPLDFDTLFRLVKIKIATEDTEALHRVLNLLERDHYLVRRGGRFTFQFPLIAQSWRLRRGL